MNPADVPITREMTWGWLTDYDGLIKDTKKMRDFLTEHIEAEGVDPLTPVDTTGNQSLPDFTTILDMILLDIESYEDANRQ